MIDSPDALKELLPNVSRETIEKLAEYRDCLLYTSPSQRY